MCTTAAKKINNSWWLIKTRDPVEWMRWDDEIKLFNTAADKFKKLIIQNPDQKEDGYYGGINNQGVSIVATYVHVSENQISYIRRPYIRLILDAATAQKAVKIIQAFNPRIGGNIFVADKNHCFGIEAVPEKYYVEEITKPAVKTNHFLHLSNQNLSMKSNVFFKNWSKTHQKRAEKLIKTAQNLKDLKNLLKDRQNADQKMAICTTDSEEKCYTYSAFIFDTSKAKAYYAQGNPSTTPFKEYSFI